MQLVTVVGMAVVGLALTAAACGPAPDPQPVLPPETTQAAPPPATTQAVSPPATSQPAPAPGMESTCYFTVSGGSGEGLAMSLYGTTADCGAAAAAFETQTGNAYSLTPADATVSVLGELLCNGNISDGNYNTTVYASTAAGIYSNSGSTDPVCNNLGFP